MELSEVIEIITIEPQVPSSIEGVELAIPPTPICYRGLETTIYDL